VRKQFLPFLFIIFLIGCTATEQENEGDAGRGCCTPFCTEHSPEECGQLGGTPHSAGCQNVDECKLGCCTPFCTMLTQDECGDQFGYGGDWHSQHCSELEDCDLLCCRPFNSETTQEECDQLGGTTEELPCPALEGTIAVTIGYDISCSNRTEAEAGEQDIIPQYSERFDTVNQGETMVFNIKAPSTSGQMPLEGDYSYSISGSSTYDIESRHKYICYYEEDGEEKEGTVDDKGDISDSTSYSGSCSGKIEDVDSNSYVERLGSGEYKFYIGLQIGKSSSGSYSTSDVTIVTCPNLEDEEDSFSASDSYPLECADSHFTVIIPSLTETYSKTYSFDEAFDLELPEDLPTPYRNRANCETDAHKSITLTVTPDLRWV